MKFDSRFPKQVFLTLAAGGGLSAYPLLKFASLEIIEAAAMGALLSTANVLAGYFAIEYSFEKSHTTFLKAMVGGMGIRMILMLVALVVLIKVFNMHAVALTSFLLGFYVVYLVLEIMFIQKKVLIRNQE